MVDCNDLSSAGTRRDFLQRAGAMGVGALLPGAALAGPAAA
ncbi:twin-arginine translocation signal domain-containing protein, partial [Acinetobacter baumannii]